MVNLCQDLNGEIEADQIECQRRMDAYKIQNQAQNTGRPMLGAINPNPVPSIPVNQASSLEDNLKTPSAESISTSSQVNQQPLSTIQQPDLSPGIPTHGDKISQGVNNAFDMINSAENMESDEFVGGMGEFNGLGNTMASKTHDSDPEIGHQEDAPGESSRALLVFGLATILAAVYFYIKMKRIRDKEKIHYGILDDREFEMRHLSMSSDEEVGFSMRDALEVNTPRNKKKKSVLGNALNSESSSDSEDDVTMYEIRLGNSHFAGIFCQMNFF